MALPATLLSVYRRGNAATLDDLLRPALDSGWNVRLWALDDPDERLERITLGVGPGAKFDLLTQLFALGSPSPDAFVVVADDDVAFPGGDVVSFVDLAAQAALDISQPAHVLRSHRSHRITLRRPLSRVRLTTFVEIGPLFAVSPAWQSRVLPFPHDIGMGWGLELTWMDLQHEGCRLGIVDGEPIRHLAPVASGYAAQGEAGRLAQLLRERGVPGASELRWRELQKTLATWRPWQALPPWLSADPDGGPNGALRSPSDTS